MAGHSIGELAAAHVAGVFSLADAAKLVAARARLMQALPAGGGMLAVAATAEYVAPLLAGSQDRAGIAALNAPGSVVVSGAAEVLDALAATLTADGVRSTRLRVSHAFHSPLMTPMLEDFAAVAATVGYREPAIPVISALTGAVATTEELTDPGYWVRHVREPVRFADAVLAAQAAGVTVFAEVGPGAVLSGLVARTLEEPVTVPLARDADELTGLLHGLSRLHTTGADVDWAAWFAATAPGARTVDLPTYPFKRQRYWLPAADAGADVAAAGLGAVGHPLLAAELTGPDGGVTLTGRLSLQAQPWLADHRVLGTVLLPGTGLVELALTAGARAGKPVLDELTLQAPLVLPEPGALLVRVHVTEAGDVTIHSRQDDADWTLHAAGLLSDTAPAAGWQPTAWPPPGATPLDLADAYPALARRGYAYGPTFQALTAAWRDGDELFAEVTLPSRTRTGFGIHPALLDACLHAALVADDDR